MSSPPPLIDQGVSKSPRLGIWAWVAVVAALGIIILGARSLAGLFRGLDQSGASRIPAESPADE